MPGSSGVTQVLSRVRRIPGIAVACAVVAAGLAATTAYAATAPSPPGGDALVGAAGPPVPLTAALAYAACDPGGVSAADNALADRLRPQMNGVRMGSAVTGYNVSCARVITATVAARQLDKRAAVIAVTTAITESTLHNYTQANDYDSLGLFQQRPSQGWGTPAQITDPVYATNAFLNAMLRKFPNNSWMSGDIGAICQKVQVSAVPDAYDHEVHDATLLVDALWTTSRGVSSSRVVSWGPNRLDLFGLAAGGEFRSAWDGARWLPWESLGGGFLDQPTAVSWGPNRLDVFGVGLDHQLYHQFWDGARWGPGWENLGGQFVGRPSITAWGPNRLDVFGIGTDKAMYHRAWDGARWLPWENQGGAFTSNPVVVAWGPNRLDVFGVGTDKAMYHRNWDGARWSSGWEYLGGAFTSDPAVVAWGPNRLDVFGVGTDKAMYHRNWDGTRWSSGWENLHGTFN